MKVQENVLIVIKAVLPFVVVIILFIVVGNFGFGKITEIRDQVAGAQNEQKTLTQKLDVLKNIQTLGAQSSNLVAAVLPDNNPSLSVVSQIKILAGNAGIILSQVKAGSPTVEASGLSAVSITFGANGPRAQVESFINTISSFAPISIVNRIKITESAPGAATANITVKSFWAPFPTKIPPVTSAIVDLTPAEKQTLQNLGSLTQPIFTAIQSSPGGRSDPFAP